MPAKSVKPLSRGKCLEDLKKVYDIDPGDDAKKLCKTAPKLLQAAEESRLLGDEEKSYILYMRYLSIVQRVKELRKKDESAKKYFDELSKTAMKDAIDQAEKLSESLGIRYNQLRRRSIPQAEKLKDPERPKMPPETLPVINTNENVNGFADVSDEFISCTQLYNLLNTNKRILIMDVRSTTHFDDSHMKFDCVMSIPEDIVRDGISAAALEKSLPQTSKTLWNERGRVDLLVLVDWNSSVKSLKGDHILILRKILLEWDTIVKYRNKPLLLDGGFEDWILRYPVLTTNPHPSIFPSLDSLVATDSLDDIEYPNLSESPVLSSFPSFDRSSKPSQIPSHPPASVPQSPKTCTTKPPKPSLPNFIFSVPIKVPSILSSASESSSGSRPSVDRSSKAAAVATYEERSHAVRKLLHDTEEGVKATLKMEKTRQEMEDERERVRLMREREAEEEMKLQLQEKEEKLLRNIMELEKRQKEKDRENQFLRKELEEYRRKEQEDNVPKEYSAYKENEEKINARIQSAEDQRKKLAQDRERKTHEERRNEQKKRPVLGESQEGNRMQLERERQARIFLDRQQRDKLPQDKEVHTDACGEERAKVEVRDNKERPAVPRQAGQAGHGGQGGQDGLSSQPASKSQVDPEKGSYTVPLKDSSSTNFMKRSHSSPNIAQMDDEEINGKGMFPSYPVSRPIELRMTRQRNFSPVYGSMGRGLTGLKNLGNTCYMNSIIQCLSNTTPLARYFVNGDYRNDINRHNETRGEIAEEVAAVVRAVWSSHYKCIATRDLRSAVGRYRDQFQTSQQQDSNEFLTILMDWLHEDLKKPAIKIPRDFGREQTEWEKHWDEFYKENSSLIVFLFYGQQKSTVQCLKCNEKSVRYETFSNLTLPLPSSNTCSLEECVQLYVKGEKITGWKCPMCKEPRDAMKKFDIIRLPPILVIHFKRFYIDGWCRKRQTFVKFPLSNWDMTNYSLSGNQKYTHYELYGVSNHYGTMEGGHYTAYCKSSEHRKWYKFDDNEVSELSPSEVQSGAAYILFYSSVNLSVPDIS